MSEFHKICGCDNAQRKGDVVFIHGLGGDAFMTWRHGIDESTSWPHWLGQEFPEVGVWSLGYPASPMKWTRFLGWLSKRWRDTGYSMALTERASQVLDRMVQNQLGQRPLFFICHSLGGLVAKHILRKADDADNEPHKKQVAANTREILFLATPHQGATLASLVDAFGTVFGATVSIEELRAQDAHLLDLYDWYRNHSVSLGIQTVSYYETRSIKGVLPIVSRGSAHPGVGADPVSLDEDHLSIAKPPERNAQVCGAARDLLRNHILASESSTLTALGKPPEPGPPKEPQRDDWFLVHPYPMPRNFTGRKAERAMLSDWLIGGTAQPLMVLHALGGFGKSALVWHWLLHDVPRADWPHVLWWSFYERDATFDQFVAAALDYLTGGRMKAGSLPARQQLATLLQSLQPGTLIVLDGFERALRAFSGLDAVYQGDEPSRPEPTLGQGTPQNERECVSPLADNFFRAVSTLPGIYAKVLLTTRLRPVPVETRGGILLCGCREKELTQLQPADAVEFFHAQGTRGTHTEIETACEPYGYHPLSLRLLAGLIVGDFEQPGDIAAARHLDVSGDLKARQHHVLETAYNSLTPVRQKLLSRIACFRTPVSYDALQALAESGGTLDDDLRDLVSRGLLHHDTKEGRFDLHPIVRRYAYDRLAAPDRAAAHTRLRDYFAAVPQPDKVTRLEDLAPVIELYHHTVRAGQYDEAITLFRDRLNKATYFQLGAYQLQIYLLGALFPDGEDRPPHLKDERAQAHALDELANSYSLSGQPRRAVPLYEQHNAIQEKLGSKRNLAVGLGNVADDQLKIGALRAAEANLRRSIALCREIKDEFQEAAGYQELGQLLAYRGAYAESETELATALKVFDKQKHVQAQGVTWAYRAICELLRLRWASQSAIRNPPPPAEAADLRRAGSQSAIGSARCALELADEMAHTRYPVERDYVRAHWLMGAAHRVAGQLDGAERHLHQALSRCRRINLVEVEADILIDLARLRAATGAPDEAQRLAEEALVITERSGYVLQGADARLELAKLALARGDKATALDHAKEARRLAACDGPPDYTYKAAYDEAGTLLDELKS